MLHVYLPPELSLGLLQLLQQGMLLLLRLQRRRLLRLLLHLLLLSLDLLLLRLQLRLQLRELLELLLLLRNGHLLGLQGCLRLSRVHSGQRWRMLRRHHKLRRVWVKGRYRRQTMLRIPWCSCAAYCATDSAAAERVHWSRRRN